jgi:hypothetical protein
MPVKFKMKPGLLCGHVFRSTKRLLGQILIDGDFVAPHHVETALARQKETNEQLGDILMRMGALNPMDLKAVLSVQRHLTSLEDSVKAAAGVRELLGELLVKAKRITPEQLDGALKDQKESGEKLGKILIRLGLLSQNELHAVLMFQHHQEGAAPAGEEFRLGEILVTTEQITRKQLEDVLCRQKITNKKIGELLLEAGYVQPHQVAYGLKIQQKLVTAALIAALSMATLGTVQEAYAGSSDGSLTSAKISITASVVERTRMQILDQAQELIVTGADIMRGYVEVFSASRIMVKSNNPAGYLLSFEVMSGTDAIFHAVNVIVGGHDVQLSPGGSWIPQPYSVGDVTTDVGYRFALAKDAKPGTYSWPVMVSVQSM